MILYSIKIFDRVHDSRHGNIFFFAQRAFLRDTTWLHLSISFIFTLEIKKKKIISRKSLLGQNLSLITFAYVFIIKKKFLTHAHKIKERKRKIRT